ncbi:hypothetical protein MYOV003v1_p0093 [Vibrio phage 207E48.1]|nr:hypothetical protein MYOV003v1_p0093 [Vibrio phage 207E48.1]
MIADLKTLTTFCQHLRSHLSIPHVDTTDMGIALQTVRVFPFHEEQVWNVLLTTQTTEKGKLYDVDAIHTFILRTQLVETENGYQDTFNLYEDQERVEVLDRRFVRDLVAQVAPEVAELKTESQLIIPNSFKSSKK